MTKQEYSHLHLSPTGFLFDHHSGLSFTTNSVGHFILEALLAGASRDSVLASVIEHFDVNTERAEQDLNEFLALMRQHRLIRQDHQE